MTPFFTKEDLINFQKYAGVNYSNNPTKVSIREDMTLVWEKTGYWIDEVCKYARIPLKKEFGKRWLVGGKNDKFREYTWGRIYPSETINKEIFFTLGVTQEGNFLIKIDYKQNSKVLTDNQKNLIESLTFQDNDWIYYKEISFVEIEKYDWLKLIDLTNTFIAENIFIYESIIIKAKNNGIISVPVGDFKAGNHYTGIGNSATFINREKEIIINKKHDEISQKIYNIFVKQHGESSVSREQFIGNGKKVDLITMVDNEKIIYEIKPYENARISIRESIGQLLEYAHHSTEAPFLNLVIIGIVPLQKEDTEYLSKLRSIYNLPLFYYWYDEGKGELIKND